MHQQQSLIGLPLNKGQDFGFTPNKRPDSIANRSGLGLIDRPFRCFVGFPVLNCFLFFFIFVINSSYELLTPRMTPDYPLESELVGFRIALVGMCKCSQRKYGQAKLIHDEG
jgi:hypothetical protein